MLYTIVVTYNAESYLEPCLASLANAGRVIVVDNASTDRTVEVIRRFPDYELMRSEKNLGYAGGTNLGLASALAAGADYVLILDQDARLFPDTAGKLVAFAEAYPEYGVVSPVHLAGDGRTLDPHCRRYLLQAHPAALDDALAGGAPRGAAQLSVIGCQLSGEKGEFQSAPALSPSSELRAPSRQGQDQLSVIGCQLSGKKEEDGTQSATSLSPSSELRTPRSALPAPRAERGLELPMLNSAIWLFSRRCLETVGGFDPLYFQYSADKDYCNRLAYHGLKLVIMPDAFAVHAHLKTLSAEEERQLVFESPRRLFSFEATEIKKPNVSFRREFLLSLGRLLGRTLDNAIHLKGHRARTDLAVTARLLSNWRTIRDHQAVCKTPGAHWIAP